MLRLKWMMSAILLLAVSVLLPLNSFGTISDQVKGPGVQSVNDDYGEDYSDDADYSNDAEYSDDEDSEDEIVIEQDSDEELDIDMETSDDEDTDYSYDSDYEE